MSDTPAPEVGVAEIAWHPFVPRDHPWGRCGCGLAEAAHTEAHTPYVSPPLPYRCPYCVDRGEPVCRHAAPLGIAGAPL